MIPLVQTPYIFDIRARPTNIPLVTGSKGKVQSGFWKIWGIHKFVLTNYFAGFGSSGLSCARIGITSSMTSVCVLLLWAQGFCMILFAAHCCRFTECKHYLAYTIPTPAVSFALHLCQPRYGLRWESPALHHTRSTYSRGGEFFEGCNQSSLSIASYLVLSALNDARILPQTILNRTGISTL